ncbi:MAG: hypothetical protein KDK91_31270, partial [Gammaproteobacteria bacterium]|nr:hypothetical protein [Gammaproteobacteria bacterium]
TELTPMEVAQVFQALANEGYLIPLKSISAVTRADGTPLNRYPLEVHQADPGVAVALVTRGLQAVMQEGTGRSALDALGGAGVAGKTGTTDGRRDSWFAGFDASLLGVVWVGRDDNGTTRLSGASGALQLWKDLFAGRRARSLDLASVPGLDWHWVDPSSGLRAIPECGGTRRLPFVVERIPAVNECTLAALDRQPGEVPATVPFAEAAPGESGADPPPARVAERPERGASGGIFGFIRRALPGGDPGQAVNVDDGR